MRKNIVLIHGWGAETEKLKPLADELEKTGWSVLLPKLPGFEARAPSFPWTLQDYAEFIFTRTSSEWKGKKVVVFGHSFGGRVAIKMALEYKRKVYGVVLCSSGGISRGYFLVRILFYMLAKTGKILLIVPRVAKYWRKVLYKITGEHDYEKAEGVMRKTFKKVVSEDLKKEVGQISIPTLILWGREDKITSVSDGLFIKSKVKNSKLKIFNKQGHILPYTRPKGLAKEIDIWYKSL